MTNSSIRRRKPTTTLRYAVPSCVEVEGPVHALPGAQREHPVFHVVRKGHDVVERLARHRVEALRHSGRRSDAVRLKRRDDLGVEARARGNPGTRGLESEVTADST